MHFYKVVVVTDKIRKGHMNHIVEWILIDVVTSFICSRHVSQWSRFYIRTKYRPKGLFCVRLLLASKELILLLHLLHAEAGGSVLLRLTLRLCGPILNPGSLTENILIPAEAGDKSVVKLLNLTQGYNADTVHVCCHSCCKETLNPRAFTDGRNLRPLLLVSVNVFGCSHD